MSNTRRLPRTAAHRPAIQKRRNRHDSLTALDLFSGFGGLTQGIERAGFDVIMAANHNEYKVQVHEANHPTTEHWIADLANPESSDLRSLMAAADIPEKSRGGLFSQAVNQGYLKTVRYEASEGETAHRSPIRTYRRTRQQRSVAA